MSHLVLIRHGQSVWNRERRFTGWSDVAITPKGIAECEEAGRLLADAGYRFDICFTSVLERGIAAAQATLSGLGEPDLKMEQSWHLNERHFGSLQGMQRREAMRAFGVRQVVRWQTSYDEPPPPLEDGDPRLAEVDPRYSALEAKDLPRSESLADTYRRVAPYWQQAIVPRLQQQQSVLVVAHKNSLRVLVKMIEGLSDEEVPRLQLKTGQPLAYEFDGALDLVNRAFLLPQKRDLRFWSWLSPA
jgi:2,3-bisphosphoglycerate-dependent phosphoglycerate mutase